MNSRVTYAVAFGALAVLSAVAVRSAEHPASRHEAGVAAPSEALPRDPSAARDSPWGARSAPVARAAAPIAFRSDVIGAAPAAPAPPAEKPSTPYGDDVARSPAFRAFADRARLDETQRASIARILRLYGDNRAALEETLDGDKVAPMLRQLLADTGAQLHMRIPAASWDDFVQTGLVQGVGDVVRADRNVAIRANSQP
jgi:hypothetical protein